MELFKPEFGLVFWMFVAFLCLYCILAKWAWPFIIKSMEERADLIDKGVAYAQEAKAQLDNAKDEADHLVASSRPISFAMPARCATRSSRTRVARLQSRPRR